MGGGGLAAEVAAGSEWTLLLALHLLRELRNPKSPWQAYTQLLPAPPGSLLKRLCSLGPEATDLLFFRCVAFEFVECIAGGMHSCLPSLPWQLTTNTIL